MDENTTRTIKPSKHRLIVSSIPGIFTIVAEELVCADLPLIARPANLGRTLHVVHCTSRLCMHASVSGPF